jgi:hypothetical protein
MCVNVSKNDTDCTLFDMLIDSGGLMSRTVLLTLRMLLVLLFAASVTAQTASGAIGATAQAGALATVLTGLILAGALCVEVVLVSVWMLLAMAADERIFADRTAADRWVNAAIAALAAGAVVATAGAVAVIVIQAGEPAGADVGFALLAAAAAGASAALALLVVVMRRLLHTAIGLRSELAEVI